MYRNGMVERTPQRIAVFLSFEISPGYPSAIIAAAAGTRRVISDFAISFASASTAITSTSRSGTVSNQST